MTRNGIILSEEPNLKNDYNSTVLLIHGNYQSRIYCRELATQLLNGAQDSSLQCLSIDLRGHGDSEESDYDPPHTVVSACDDILTLISTLSPRDQPKIVVGLDSLGCALALQYLYSTLSKTDSTFRHSEVGGSGAILPPRVTWLVPDLDSNQELIEQFFFDTLVCDSVVSNELDNSAFYFFKEEYADLFKKIKNITLDGSIILEHHPKIFYIDNVMDEPQELSSSFSITTSSRASAIATKLNLEEAEINKKDDTKTTLAKRLWTLPEDDTTVVPLQKTVAAISKFLL